MITNARSAREASLARKQFQEAAKVQFVLDVVAKHIETNTSLSVDVAIKLSEAADICSILHSKGFRYYAKGICLDDLGQYRGSDRTHIFTISWSDA